MTEVGFVKSVKEKLDFFFGTSTFLSIELRTDFLLLSK